MANSMAAAAVESVSPLTVAGGTMLPTFFHHEQIAGLALGDQLGEPARVRAGEEKGFRILALPGQLLAARPVSTGLLALKAVDTFSEPLHGTGWARRL